MNNDLIKKAEKWLTEKPKPMLPVQAASVIISCKEKFEAEEWTGEGGQDGKDKILRFFDYLSSSLYSLESYDKTGLPFGQKALGKAKKLLAELSYDEASIINRYSNASIGTSSHSDADFGNDFGRQLLSCDKKNISAFTARAKRIDHGNAYSLANFEEAIASALKNSNYPEYVTSSVITHMGQIQVSLNYNKHWSSSERLKRESAPKEGPKSAYEMLVCSVAFMKIYELTDLKLERDPMNLLGVNVLAFINTIHKQLDDLPDQSLLRNVESDIDAIASLAKTHTLSTSRFVGLMRFYVAHSAGKFDVHDHSILESRIVGAFECVLEDQIEGNGYGDLYRKNPEFLSRSLKWADEFISEYSRPDVEAVAENIISSIKSNFAGRKQSKLIEAFEAVRASKPDNMDEVVLLYYEEREEFRKLRQSIFKAVKKRDGEDGPKRSFLKSLAKNNVSELKLLGLDGDGIVDMRNTGRIPSFSDTDQPQLTVEHIQDRDIGGTNHQSNFILMSQGVNALKDKFKQQQLKCLPHHKDGDWFISWVPKKNENESYPKIFVPD